MQSGKGRKCGRVPSDACSGCSYCGDEVPIYRCEAHPDGPTATEPLCASCFDRRGCDACKEEAIEEAAEWRGTGE